MKRTESFTRTVTTNKANVICVEIANANVSIVEVITFGKYNEKETLQEAEKKAIGMKPVAVQSVETSEDLYICTLADFLTIAHKTDKRYATKADE